MIYVLLDFRGLGAISSLPSTCPYEEHGAIRERIYVLAAPKICCPLFSGSRRHDTRLTQIIPPPPNIHTCRTTKRDIFRTAAAILAGAELSCSFHCIESPTSRGFALDRDSTHMISSMYRATKRNKNKETAGKTRPRAGTVPGACM